VGWWWSRSQEQGDKKWDGMSCEYAQRRPGIPGWPSSNYICVIAGGYLIGFACGLQYVLYSQLLNGVQVMPPPALVAQKITDFSFRCSLMRLKMKALLAEIKGQQVCLPSNKDKEYSYQTRTVNK
jgi:hypothetical protein